MFVCHGNICRSPMGEYILKHMVKERGLSDQFSIASAAISDEERGNPVYPPAQRKLAEKGVPFGNHSAHKISKEEFDSQDLVIVMDRSNLKWLSRIVGDCMDAQAGESLEGSGISGKVHMMMEFAGNPRDVADPWYTGDFEKTYQDVLAGCTGLLKLIKL